jgi:POT family proton-dependent oligopeptide transporter
MYSVVQLTVSTENYLQNAPGGEVPGALGLHQATASNIVNALIIGSYIVPVPAAVVADSWLGRYKTMIYAAMYCEALFLYLTLSP